MNEFGKRGNGYDWDRGMSVNAVNAYTAGEMPLSRWTRRDILEEIESKKMQSCTVKEVNEIMDFFKTWKKDQLEYLLRFSSWHHTSGAYNRTSFYMVSEKLIDDCFEQKYKPPRSINELPEFEQGFVHGIYKEVEYHPYSRHRKYNEEWIPFENGRIKNDWLYLNGKRTKKMSNVVVEKITKNKRRKKKN